MNLRGAMMTGAGMVVTVWTAEAGVMMAGIAGRGTGRTVRRIRREAVIAHGVSARPAVEMPFRRN